MTIKDIKKNDFCFDERVKSKQHAVNPIAENSAKRRSQRLSLNSLTPSPLPFRRLPPRLRLRDRNDHIEIRSYKSYLGTVEPRFNEVPRDWANWFVISRVRYIENLVITSFLENNQSVRYIGV